MSDRLRQSRVYKGEVIVWLWLQNICQIVLQTSVVTTYISFMTKKPWEKLLPVLHRSSTIVVNVTLGVTTIIYSTSRHLNPLTIFLDKTKRNKTNIYKAIYKGQLSLIPSLIEKLLATDYKHCNELAMNRQCNKSKCFLASRVLGSLHEITFVRCI